MKKVLSVFTAICLVLAMSLSCFAASVSLADSDPVLDTISGIVSKIGSVDDEQKEFTSDDAIAAIVNVIKGLGAENTDEALDIADQLYNYGAITPEVYNALKEAIKNDKELDKDGEKNDIIEKVQKIMEDDSLDTAGKAAEIGKLLIGLPVDQVQDILDTLLDNGTIDNDMYNRISDIINNASIDNITNIFNGGGNSGLGGITDLISSILGMLGLGGGDDGGDSGNGGSNKSSNNNNSSSNNSSNNGSSESSSNQVPNTKTGDYALVSVIGVATVAGAAFLLTRKKKSDEE